MPFNPHSPCPDSLARVQTQEYDYSGWNNLFQGLRPGDDCVTVGNAIAPNSRNSVVDIESKMKLGQEKRVSEFTASTAASGGFSGRTSLCFEAYSRGFDQPVTDQIHCLQVPLNARAARFDCGFKLNMPSLAPSGAQVCTNSDSDRIKQKNAELIALIEQNIEDAKKNPVARLNQVVNDPPQILDVATLLSSISALGDTNTPIQAGPSGVQWQAPSSRFDHITFIPGANMSAEFIGVARGYRERGDFVGLSNYSKHCRGGCSPCHYHARAKRVHGCKLGNTCKFCHFCSNSRARSYDQYCNHANSRDARKRCKAWNRAVIIEQEQCEYSEFLKTELGREFLAAIFCETCDRF